MFSTNGDLHVCRGNEISIGHGCEIAACASTVFTRRQDGRSGSQLWLGSVDHTPLDIRKQPRSLTRYRRVLPHPIHPVPEEGIGFDRLMLAVPIEAVFDLTQWLPLLRELLNHGCCMDVAWMLHYVHLPLSNAFVRPRLRFKPDSRVQHV